MPNAQVFTDMAVEGMGWLLRRHFVAQASPDPPPRGESKSRKALEDWLETEKQRVLACDPAPYAAQAAVMVAPLARQPEAQGTDDAPEGATVFDSEEVALLEKPGCTGARSILAVEGMLRHLSEGKRGWPVLATDAPKQLEIAARGADLMGDQAQAQAVRDFSKRLPQVRDADAAKQALADLAPLVDAEWELGRRCGGSAAVDLLAKAKELTARVAAGEMSSDDARALLVKERDATV